MYAVCSEHLPYTSPLNTLCAGRAVLGLKSQIQREYVNRALRSWCWCILMTQSVTHKEIWEQPVNWCLVCTNSALDTVFVKARTFTSHIWALFRVHREQPRGQSVCFYYYYSLYFNTKSILILLQYYYSTVIKELKLFLKRSYYLADKRALKYKWDWVYKTQYFKSLNLWTIPRKTIVFFFFFT